MRPVRPVAMVVLVALTSACWIAARIGHAGAMLSVYAGFVPIRLLHPSLVAGQGSVVPIWLAPLSATFLHGSLMHLFFNMLMLGFVGRFVEPVLGTGRFLVLYGIGAYAAALGQWIAGPASAVPMIGASGAISAVVAAHAMIYGAKRPRARWPFSADFLNMAWLAAAWIVLQYLTIHAIGNGIAIAAHIGGFLAGLVFASIATRPVDGEDAGDEALIG